ncbi:MAG: DEAD/DEAH box helicase [Candidatus Heimdallarchaeota archaeon]|nr:DEAD/DEAH box helicase [Candidatus Heimdallarchaeota archaeon]
MSSRAFQYYVFLTDFQEETHKVKMLLLPARAKASRIIPLERAKLQFVIEKGDLLRPYKYLVQDKTGSDYRRPETITKIFREAKGILIPIDERPENFELWQEYFSTFNIDKPLFRRICPLCMIDQQKITLLPAEDNYFVSGQTACFECAKDELTRELASREMGLNRFGLQHFLRVLKKLKNVDRVLEAFDYDFQPTKKPELTLFDTLGDVDDLSQAAYIDHLSIPGRLKEILKSNGIKRLLPIQTKALDAGLLKGKDLLIVAGTSSGKTLIGELAGLKNLLNNRKMVYLSPLVALTNQKYEDFKKKYSKENWRVAIRVGMSRIDVGDEEQYIVDTDYRRADMIAATYEAFDLILRNGNAKLLGEVGTVIIDEIQLLSDTERGPEIDGLISRIRALFPKAQILGLSATIGNPIILAKELKLQPLLHTPRPIPLERHVIISRDQEEKEKYLRNLIRVEYNRRSSYGFRGQSIVFSNSRRHCQALSSYLNKSGLRTKVYHSGLTYQERKRVEDGFAAGKYAAVITTAALGAGVDFPASQVIFESLAMGIKWLSVAEFYQMIGRAGRLGYHDKGKVVLLVEPNKKYFSAMEETEDNIAFLLLSEPIEPVEPVMEGEKQLEQILATIVALKDPTLKQIAKIYHQGLLGPTEPLKISLRTLQELDMIKVYSKGPRPTQLGRATARTYLPPTEAGTIKKQLQNRSPLEIAIGMEPLTSVYINSKLQGEIEKVLKGGYIGSNLFSGSLLEFMDSSLERRSSLPRLIINTFAKWQTDIFTCHCVDNPWCGCGERALSRIIVKYRLANNNLRKIASKLSTEYNLYAYPGDIYRWFDTLIHHLRAVAKLALVFEEKQTVKLALNTIKLIERPWIISKKRKMANQKSSSSSSSSSSSPSKTA